AAARALARMRDLRSKSGAVFARRGEVEVEQLKELLEVAGCRAAADTDLDRLDARRYARAARHQTLGELRSVERADAGCLHDAIRQPGRHVALRRSERCPTGTPCVDQHLVGHEARRLHEY